MRAPIHSRKHYVQTTFSTVTGASRANVTIVNAVAVADKNSPSEVVEGAVVKAVYIEYWTISSAGDGSQVFIVSKNGQGQAGPLYAECIALDTWDNKKNILHVMQGLASNDGISTPMCVFKGWIKIPKSKQRFGLGDQLVVTIANPHATNDLDYCGFATYKEYQ